MPLTDLHIVSFDVPFPPDYGGVIDVFYKLKALHQKGVRITLHCFEYGRKPRPELEKYAAKVFYYERKTTKSLLFNTYPYIVLTRSSPELKKRLMEDSAPILMEGIHSTFLLNDPDLGKRSIIVRTHNVEHVYYENLARVEKNIFKRYYFYNEAGKLLKYESVLKKASGIAAISPADTKHFSSLQSSVHYIPAFHPFDEVKVKEGSGTFAFYHGNLSVGENNEAAIYLVEKVFNDLPFRLIIAGSRPSQELIKVVKNASNVTLKSDLTPEEIQTHIADAQCNVLPTFQCTGIKLKLLAALFSGRATIVNTPMVKDTGLESLCIVAVTPAEMKSEIIKVMESSGFDSSQLAKRSAVLSSVFSNKINVEKLISLF